MVVRRSFITGLISLAAVLAATAAAPQSTSRAVPRTPWGDPDLQGTYTNKYEQGTPFERPEEFDGRRIEDIKSDELADILKERQDLVLLRTALAGGDPAGNLGGPLHWQDQFEIQKGSRPWFVTDPADGRIPPTTAEARARATARQEGRRGRGSADSWLDRSLYDRCITRGLPGSMMPAIYGNSYEILQAPGVVAIRYEMVNEVRIIPLDPVSPRGSAPAPPIRGHMGYGRGRFDGDTLVIETTNFRDESVYRGANPDRLKLIERFTPRPDGKLEWSVTVDDPTTWTQTWTFAMPLTANPDERIMEYACHEGNRAMANILSAARTEERAAAEAAKKGITLELSDIPTAAEGER